MSVPRFAKMAANLDGHPKVRRAGRAGREVFLFVLRKNAELDRSGRVPLDRVEPWFLADQLMMPEAEAVEGLARAIKFGLLTRSATDISIVGWDDEWAKAPLDEAERKRRQREREEKPSVASDVTFSHESIVTDSDCPDSHASDQKRREEKRSEESSGRASASPLAIPKTTKRKRSSAKVAMPPGWMPNADHASQARAAHANIELEADAFRDHHAAKASLFADWNAAFRNWLRNAQRFARSGSYAPTKRNNPTETALEGLREAEERARHGAGVDDPFGDAPHAAEVAP